MSRDVPPLPDSSVSLPPPPPPPPGLPPAPPAQRNIAMLVLSYLGLLALIPLVVVKDDREVQWHAKHGLVLTVAFIALSLAASFMTFLSGLFFFLNPLVYVGWLVVSVLAMLKAINGQRFLIPGISEYADRF
jgi:uncharacterized membrane protein